MTLADFGNLADRAQHVQYACDEAEQQEDDQPPGRCPRQPVDPPAETGADRHSCDELAGKLHCLAVAGGAAGAFLPLLPVRLSRGKGCFEISTAAFEVVVAVVCTLPAWPGFSGFVWPI